MDWLFAQPYETYYTREQVARAIGSTKCGAGNVLARLFERGLVTCVSDNNVDWTWRAVRGRCSSRYHEGARLWRCTREEGHRGRHLNNAGGRLWTR